MWSQRPLRPQTLSSVNGPDSLREGYTSFTKQWEETFASLAAFLGLRIRPESDISQFVMVLVALDQGFALRHRINGMVEYVSRPTGPNGENEDWTLFALGLEGLVHQFFEIDPDWQPQRNDVVDSEGLRPTVGGPIAPMHHALSPQTRDAGPWSSVVGDSAALTWTLATQSSGATRSRNSVSMEDLAFAQVPPNHRVGGIPESVRFSEHPDGGPKPERTFLAALSPIPRHHTSAHGRIRTCDARFRKPTLYPRATRAGVGWSPATRRTLSRIHGMHATCRRRSNGRGSLHACGHRASRPDRRIAPISEVCVRSAYTLCRGIGIVSTMIRRVGVAISERIVTASGVPCSRSPSVPRTGSTFGARLPPTPRPSARRYAGTGAAVYRSSTTVDTQVRRTPSTTDPGA